MSIEIKDLQKIYDKAYVSKNIPQCFYVSPNDYKHIQNLMEKCFVPTNRNISRDVITFNNIPIYSKHIIDGIVLLLCKDSFDRNVYMQLVVEYPKNFLKIPPVFRKNDIKEEPKEKINDVKETISIEEQVLNDLKNKSDKYKAVLYLQLYAEGMNLEKAEKIKHNLKK